MGMCVNPWQVSVLQFNPGARYWPASFAKACAAHSVACSRQNCHPNHPDRISLAQDQQAKAGHDRQTLDNPGWQVIVNRLGTPNAHIPCAPIQLRMGRGADWLTMSKTGTDLTGACGPMALEQLLSAMCDWLERPVDHRADG